MIRERAVVQELTAPDRALVQVKRTEACAGCAARGMCHALGGQSKDVVVEVLNDKTNVKPGDIVEISIPSSSFLKSMSVIYMIPVMALMAGLFIGIYIAKNFCHIDPSIGGLLGSVVGVSIAFAFARWYDRKAHNKPEYWPKITRVIENNNESASSTISRDFPE